MLKRNIYFFILSLALLSCKQKIHGIILDKITKSVIDSVAVSEHSFENSYPYHYEYSDGNGHFSFSKEIRNSVLYFYKRDYNELRVDFKNNYSDTIYLDRKE